MNEKRDHYICEVKDTKHGKVPAITAPDQVLEIHDKEELELQLQHYARPILRHTCPNSTFARRFYIEKVRPALRYYCRKFQVKVPAWLVNEDMYLGMTDAEKQELFGTTKLHPREFAKLPTFPPGQVMVRK